MARSTFARRSNRAVFARTSAEGGGGGTGGQNDGNQQQGGTGGQNDGNQQQQGGAGDQQQNSGPVDATDEHGASLGFPKDTAVKDMNDVQRSNYWRNQAKVQQRRVAELERAQNQQQGNQNSNDSGTVRNQQQGDDKKTGSVDEAAIRREAAMDAASASIRTALAARNKSAEEIDEIVDLLDTSKFLTAENKLDSAKITAFVTKTVPVRGGEGGVPGQGQQQQQAQSKAAAGQAAAQKRWGSSDKQENRGQFGGLRR